MEKGEKEREKEEERKRDEGGRKKIKKRKVGLKDTGDRLVDFRDTWVTVEDERIEMGQRESSEDESEIEEVQQKRKRRDNKNRIKYDNVHEREMRTLTKLVRHRFRLEYKGGSTVITSESRMNEEKYQGVILDGKQKE
jgi:hypothetical protein